MAPGFTRSRNRKQFYIWMLVRKAPKGRKVQILLKDASTWKDLVQVRGAELGRDVYGNEDRGLEAST